jgi:hypothetical protein
LQRQVENLALHLQRQFEILALYLQRQFETLALHLQRKIENFALHLPFAYPRIPSIDSTSFWLRLLGLGWSWRNVKF